MAELSKSGQSCPRTLEKSCSIDFLNVNVSLRPIYSAYHSCASRMIACIPGWGTKLHATLSVWVLRIALLSECWWHALRNRPPPYPPGSIRTCSGVSQLAATRKKPTFLGILHRPGVAGKDVNPFLSLSPPPEETSPGSSMISGRRQNISRRECLACQKRHAETFLPNSAIYSVWRLTSLNKHSLGSKSQHI